MCGNKLPTAIFIAERNSAISELFPFAMKCRNAIFVIAFVILFPFDALSQKSTRLWDEFVEAKKQGKQPFLPDFSFAGYHWGEKPLPSLQGRDTVFVDRYGAKPNDGEFDDVGIQQAIAVAQRKPNGAVVFFPAGKYLIAPDQDASKNISITKSNIVLAGAGAGEGGTEIFQANMRINGRQIMFGPLEKNNNRPLAIIEKDAQRESFSVVVDNARDLKPGQDIVIRHKSEEYTREYFNPLPLKPAWTRLYGPKGGMLVHEIHTIESIEGRKVVFKNPLHLDIVRVAAAQWEVLPYHSIENCGIEGIRFSSAWKDYPEAFEHHKNEIHDYAYEAIGMENVKDCWIKDCVFQDWNECIHVRECYKVSLINIGFIGKKGHASIHARSGYGVLIKNCAFNGAQHHGGGTGYSASGTVIAQCSYAKDQNFDSHSGQPYATLFDDITGGVFYNLGGPEPGHPHHGKHLVLWNFRHSSEEDQAYDFWDMSKRRNYTIANPILVGFQSDTKVTFRHEGLNEDQGKLVRPKSLYEAQLALRLGKAVPE